MNRRTLTGALVLVSAVGLLAALTDVSGPTYSAFERADCGKQPPFSYEPSPELIDHWYEYGDCSGYYGPIDAAGVIMPEGYGEAMPEGYPEDSLEVSNAEAQ